jgi:hypothetical protein
VDPETVSDRSIWVVQDIDGANGSSKAIAAADMLDAKAICVSK